MKLYAVSDGPPSLAVRMTLKALEIQYQLVNVDFCALEHRTEDYAKVRDKVFQVKMQFLIERFSIDR